MSLHIEIIFISQNTQYFVKKSRNPRVLGNWATDEINCASSYHVNNLFSYVFFLK